jgi:hypothetical protein
MSKALPLALPNMSQQWDTSVYDLLTPRCAPDISTPARQAAVTLENSIRTNIFETGAFFNSNGRLITQKVGTGSQVRFDSHELVGTKGSLFTHNHPDGLPFSPQDVEQAIDIGLIELRAVAHHCRYILQPNGNWPSWSAIESALLRHAPVARQDVAAMVQSTYLANSNVDKELQHRLWVLVANDLNLHYFREKS